MEVKRLAGSCWVITALSSTTENQQLPMHIRQCVCVFCKSSRIFCWKERKVQERDLLHVFSTWEDTCQHVYAGIYMFK